MPGASGQRAGSEEVQPIGMDGEFESSTAGRHGLGSKGLLAVMMAYLLYLY